MKLYENSEAMSKLIAEIDETGELTADQEKLFDELELARADKIAGIVYHIMNLKAQEKACKEAEARLKAKKDSAKKSYESYQSFLELLLKDTPEFMHNEITLKWQNNPASVVVLDEEEVPSCYKVSKTTWSIDKKSLKADLQDPEVEVPGAILKAGRRLVVK